MIDAGAVRETIEQYEKHGWTLRRVLLCQPENFSPPDNLFGGAPVAASDIDALWFSRLSKGGEAWELRRLSGAPFAFVETFPVDTDEEARELKRREIEMKMRAK